MGSRFALSLVCTLLLASCAEDTGIFTHPSVAVAPLDSTTGPASAETTAPAATPVQTTAPGTTLAAPTTTGADITPPVWSRVADDGTLLGGPGDQSLASVAEGGPGLIAVGSDASAGDADAAVWISNDGLVWQRVPHDAAVFGGLDRQVMQGLAASGPSAVAVGNDWSGGDEDAAMWFSPDGLTWSRAPHDEAVFGGPGDQSADAVAAGGPGLVAVGRDSSGGDYDLAVWLSPDGAVWSRVPHDEALFGGPADQVAHAVVRGPAGLVVVGVDYGEGDGDAAIWLSADGVAWSRVPHDEALFGGPGNQGMQAALVGPSGIVAVGHDSAQGDADAAIWLSADGVTWSRVPHDEAVFGGPGDQGMAAVAALGSAVIALGFDYSTGDGAGDGVVWIASDGMTWSRLPAHQEVFGGPGEQRVRQLTAGGLGLIAVGWSDAGGDDDGLIWMATPAP